jgi:hypothetical protein
MSRGAINLSACPRPIRGGNCGCRVRCLSCGERPHTAVHGPYYGQPPGSKPYDHEFDGVVDDWSTEVQRWREEGK